MHYNDHAPPPFHASYGGREAQIDIASFQFIQGRLPARATRLVLEWAEMHRDELTENWRRRTLKQPLRRIEALD